jgi:hypothetical protein
MGGPVGGTVGRTVGSAIVGLAASSFLATPVFGQQVLLIPDSANDKVWAFDPFDGALISDNFIPDDGRLVQPIAAIDSGFSSVLISDELADAVFEYSYNGVYLRTIVPTTAGIDSPFGMTIANGWLYVASPTQRKVYRCKPDGTELSVWWDAAPFNAAPRDLLVREGDVLVTDSQKDAIERVSFAGAYLGSLVDSDGITGIDFPNQLDAIPGGVVVAGFNAPIGLYVYDDAGPQDFVATNLATAPRGVRLLGTGEFLYTGGTRVMAYNPSTLSERTIINQSGANFRFVEEISLSSPCPGDLTSDGVVDGADLAVVLGAWGSPVADLDGNGVTNGADLSILLGSWGDC